MLYWKSYIFLIILTFAIFFKANGNIAFFHFGVDKGLPDVRIVSISQDSAGFIWLAGEHNIYRFDGDRFKFYHNTGTKSTEASFGRIITLFTDSRGTLWAGTSTGLAWYDSRGDVFLRPQEGWMKEDVNDIAEDPGGSIWAATSEGLARIDAVTRETTWYRGPGADSSAHHRDLPVNSITNLTCQEDGKIWFTEKMGELYQFDPVSLQTKSFSSLTAAQVRFEEISNIHYANQRLLISTLSQGFYWFDFNKKELKNEKFSSLGYTFHHFTPENDSMIWLAGNNGLYYFNLNSLEFTRYTEEDGNPLSLTRTALTHVFTDRENNLWISSGLQGVDYGLTSTPFQHLSNAGSGPYQLTQPEVTAIEFDRENNMWLGYEGGFIEKHTHTPLRKILFRPDPKNVASNQGAIFKILSDSKNQIWMGGWNTGLQKLNQSTASFEIAPVVPDSLSEMLKSADIRGIAEDHQGNLWISYHGIGIGRYEPHTAKMELFRHDPDNVEGSLSNDWTFNLCIDNGNNLWIATSYGVSRLNLQEKTFQNYLHEDNNPHSLNLNYVTTIYCDPSGTIWAGTENGLNVFIPSLNNFVPVFDMADNSSYSISAIRSTKPGEIWASTKSGITGISWSWDTLQKGIIANTRFFNRRSGLLSTSYIARSSAVNNEGEIYFGGNEGIDFFNGAEASSFQLPNPKPVLTDLVIDGLPVWFDREQQKTVNLDHQHRMISIRFSAPSFHNPHRQNFRYMLEGFDQQWNYTQYEQLAVYTNLPAGEYTFRVESEDRNGKWSPDAATMPISVKPPFWNTIPFYILAGVFLVLLVFIIVYARSRIFLLRQKELEKIIDARTQELVYNNAELQKLNHTKNKLFSIISHDLRSPFSGVLGILELLTDEQSGIEDERKNELLVMAKKSAENTFELLDNLLTWAHSQMKKTYSRPVKQNLCFLLEKNIELKKTAAHQKEIELKRNYPEKLDASYDHEMINTVVRNLLNNAIKFTNPGGRIEISAFGQNGEVTVSIADTGIGIDEEDAEAIFHEGIISRKGTMGEKGTGLGLVICREFVEKNSGKIWVTANQPKGTVFNFTLPVDHYRSLH